MRHAFLSLGDVVGDKSTHYRVRGKLGQNESNTTYLVQNINTSKFHTLKAMRWDYSYSYSADKDKDYRPNWRKDSFVIQTELARPSQRPGSEFINKLKHSFTYKSGWHTYQCFIFEEPLGESVDGFRERFRDGQIPLSVAKDIIRQVTKAVGHLHQRGVVATTLSKDNVYFKVADREASLKRYCDHNLERYANREFHCLEVEKIDSFFTYPQDKDGNPIVEVSLFNLDHVHRSGTRLAIELDDRAVYSPELLIGIPVQIADEHDPTPKVYPSTDAWNLASLHFELLTHYPLLPGHGQSACAPLGCSQAEVRLAEMLAMLGPLPEQMKQDCKQRSNLKLNPWYPLQNDSQIMVYLRAEKETGDVSF
jgi:serine/threonine protein kinase